MPATGTTSSPSGLDRVEASLARNFVGATPTEQVMPCSSAIRARIHSPIQAGRPSRRQAPPTSRNASSMDSGSTSGVIDRNTAITPADTSAYVDMFGGTTTACGQSRRAWVIGMALCTPLARAS